MKQRLTSKVPSQHEIQYEKAVFIILKCVPKIHDERMVNLGNRWSKN